MKKLRLKALELGASELLKREQLRNVIGGSGGSGSGNPLTDGCKACQPNGPTGGNIGCYRHAVGEDCLCVWPAYKCDKPRL